MKSKYTVEFFFSYGDYPLLRRYEVEATNTAMAFGVALKDDEENYEEYPVVDLKNKPLIVCIRDEKGKLLLDSEAETFNKIVTKVLAEGSNG